MKKKLENNGPANVQMIKFEPEEAKVEERDTIEFYRATIPKIFKNIPLKGGSEYNMAQDLYLTFKDAHPDNTDPSVADFLHFCGESFTHRQKTVDVSDFHRASLVSIFYNIEEQNININRLEDMEKLNKYLILIFQYVIEKKVNPEGTQIVKVIKNIIESINARLKELKTKSQQVQQIMEMPTMKQSIKKITAPKSGETKISN